MSGLGVVKLLLEHGADMHARDEDNATPLHLACTRGRLDIARVLLECDAKAQALRQRMTQMWSHLRVR